ncbi:hypothetical protein GB931_04140 [Modestobacter sp. I12A-02628]|uniref:Uncharacterized protein n=1 Tax=Goekera deserti TaxID=2497753 RepID=A0A7K3WIJ3_9ACTN|nr:hypothetical protein [Goekera deserti]MPQ97127.1 hypothetical protein [Goekera deserti]NDI46555.1 hypothetical protein [Goekera deserti]NEL56311.1 hypothetical protein [Goekera deserti]
MNSLAHPRTPAGAITRLVVIGPVLGCRLLDRPRLPWAVAAAASLPVVVLTLWPVATRAFARTSWDQHVQRLVLGQICHAEPGVATADLAVARSPAVG